MSISFTSVTENSRRAKVPASILLEALVALAVFAFIASLLLGEISRSRREETRLLQEEEVLRVARMALQTQQQELTVNQITVQLVQTDKSLTVYHQGKEVLHVHQT